MNLTEFQRMMEQRNRSAGYRLPTGVYGFGPVGAEQKRGSESRSKPRKSGSGTTTPATPKRRSTGQPGASNGPSRAPARRAKTKVRTRLVRTSVTHPIAVKIMNELDGKHVSPQFGDTPLDPTLTYRVEFHQVKG